MAFCLFLVDEDNKNNLEQLSFPKQKEKELPILPFLVDEDN